MLFLSFILRRFARIDPVRARSSDLAAAVMVAFLMTSYDECISSHDAAIVQTCHQTYIHRTDVILS